MPEFVIGKIQYPELFTFKEDRFYNEYIVPVSQFYPLKNMTEHRRRKVERLIKKVGEDNIVVKSLDLSDPVKCALLVEAAENWRPKNINEYGKVEGEAIALSIQHAEKLKTENICLLRLRMFMLTLGPVNFFRKYVIEPA